MNTHRNIICAALMSLAINATIAAESDEATNCEEFRALGWLDGDTLINFRLAGENTLNDIDIDGDAIADPITSSCAGSVVPADPCYVDITLSSGGNLGFEPWVYYLAEHQGQTYAISGLPHMDERGRLTDVGYTIYRLGPTDIQAVCRTP
ncbi:MAG: hypothetical protein LBE21_08200 [Pseudomonadales bacterium]|jgi:hypothetical protein|nr:hypothetical protein [Pseudomonadales bacterium]